MWIPLVAVIIVLAVLVAAPFVVSARLRRQRAVISDVVDPARVRATNLTAFLAQEMFAVGMRAPAGGTSRDEQYAAAMVGEHGAALALDSLLRFADANALEQFAQYRESASRWHAEVAALRQPPTTAAIDTASAEGAAALEAARRLVMILEQVSTSERSTVRRTERFDLLLPAALVPLALAACVLVVLAGRRTVALALRAEESRRALAIAMAQKSAFMRGISHDLQNPLGAALGNIELLLDGIIKPEQHRDVLVRVRRLVRTASETVASLLSIARSETGDVHLHPTTIDLCALVRAAVDDHELVAGAKRQSIEFIETGECHAMGDAGRVRHIVDNLLSNSIKYTPEGGRIRVVVAMEDRAGHHWAVVTVQDSGPGIPGDWHERVFDEFARVPASRDLAPGHGIGLSVSRRIARMMGGDLTVENSTDADVGDVPLHGAVLLLRLPQASSNGNRTRSLAV